MPLTTKTTNDEPAEGCAIITRTEESYRRTRNGAWVAGTSRDTSFEIPLSELNTPEGARWLSPSVTQHLFVRLPGNQYLSVSGETPLRVNGFGPLADCPEVGLVNLPHPSLPNLLPAYSRVVWVSDEQLATLKPIS